MNDYYVWLECDNEGGRRIATGISRELACEIANNIYDVLVDGMGTRVTVWAHNSLNVETSKL